MNKLIEKARAFKYHSCQYVTPESSILVLEDNTFLLIAEKNEAKLSIHWACDSIESLIKGLNSLSKELKGQEITLGFIPGDFVQALENDGYHVKCEFVDFWNKNLDDFHMKPTNHLDIRSIHPNELAAASLVTKACKGLSRGFDGEEITGLQEWLKENNEIFIATKDNEILGICMMATYQKDQNVVAWLRELAVHPNHQRTGIGRSLAITGLNWGKSKGASLSFLATDIENSPAIRLYNELGFKQTTPRGEINMCKKI